MRIPILLILTFLPSALFAAEPPSPPSPASAPAQTRYAARQIRVPNYPLFARSTDNQDEAFHKTAGDLASRETGLPWETLSKRLKFNSSIKDGERDWWITLALPPDGGAKPVAKEYLDKLIAGWQDALRQAYEKDKAAALDPLTQTLNAEAQRTDQAAARTAEMRSKLRDVAGRADVSHNGIQAAVAKLEEERQRLELDVMGKTARRQALEKEIARQTDLAAKKVDDDPIAAELQKVVEIREQRAKQMEEQHKSGIVPAAELSEAVAQAAETRAKLLERKREATVEAGGATLEAFNRELLTLSVDLRELEARLDFVKERLAALRQAMDLLEPLSRAESELEQARADYDSASKSMRELRRRIELSKPPTIEVLWSDNRAEPPKTPKSDANGASPEF